MIVLVSLLTADMLSMHRGSLPKQMGSSNRSGPIMMTFGEIHSVDGELEVRWRGESGWGETSTRLAEVGTTPWFMRRGEGVLHATSVSGFCTPARPLDGLDEREVAILIHNSALQSQSEAALGFRQLVPEAITMLSQGKLQYREAKPIGYLRNAIFLSLFAILLFCVSKGRSDLWMKRILKAIGPPQHDPDACPECGYDATGLTRCPECGRKL
ncbi:MAG: hypothetical protein RIE32_12130 [Phycisphaerales bacterium]